jgi:hypothetical protein
MDEKLCTKCNEVKALTEFYGRESGYRMSHCKKCHNKRVTDRARYRWDNDPEYRARRMEKKREWYQTKKGKRCHANASFRLLYGITHDDYDRMVEEQGGKCAICSATTNSKRNPRNNLDVDHDHGNGSVRGLLCNACNLGIGKFADDPELLRKAADYIDIFGGL